MAKFCRSNLVNDSYSTGAEDHFLKLISFAYTETIILR